MCEVMRRLCEAGKRAGEGRRGMAGRNCNGLVVEGLSESTMTEDEDDEKRETDLLEE